MAFWCERGSNSISEFSRARRPTTTNHFAQPGTVQLHAKRIINRQYRLPNKLDGIGIMYIKSVVRFGGRGRPLMSEPSGMLVYPLHYDSNFRNWKLFYSVVGFELASNLVAASIARHNLFFFFHLFWSAAYADCAPFIRAKRNYIELWPSSRLFQSTSIWFKHRSNLINTFHAPRATWMIIDWIACG